MKKYKKCIFIVSIVFIIFGSFGFMLSLGGDNNDDYFLKVKSINNVNGIAVDSIGNIYIGDLERSYIQVFNKEGNFLYGFSISAGGMRSYYSFGIDKVDVIHVVTISNYFKFKNGELIHQEKIESKNELEELYDMSKSNVFKTRDKVYKFTFLKNLKIIDTQNNKIEIVKLNIPIFPLPISFFWFVAAIGMILFFWSYGFQLMKSMKIKF